MLWLVLASVLTFHSGIVIDAQCDSRVTLALQFGDVIYTAEFSQAALKCDALSIGNQVQAEVTSNEMTLRRRDGKIVSGRVIRVQRILVYPHP